MLRALASPEQLADWDIFYYNKFTITRDYYLKMIFYKPKLKLYTWCD